MGGRYANRVDRVLDCATREALWAAIAAVARAAAGETTGRATRLNAIGDAVEAVVAQVSEREGVSLGILEDYVGHGIGTAMHMDPDVLNYSVRRKGPRLRPGMVLAIEPMLTARVPPSGSTPWRSCPGECGCSLPPTAVWRAWRLTASSRVPCARPRRRRRSAVLGNTVSVRLLAW